MEVIDGKLIVVLGGFMFLFFNFFGIFLEFLLILKLFLFLFNTGFLVKLNGLFSYKFNIGFLIDNMFKLFVIFFSEVGFDYVYILEMKFNY